MRGGEGGSVDERGVGECEGVGVGVRSAVCCDITTQRHPTHPPLCRELVKVELKPDGRQKRMDAESSRLTENLTSPEVHSVSGFVTVYAFMCRYYGIPFREDVAWVSM